MSSDKKYEEYACVLDYLPFGKSSAERTSFRATPVVQLLGEEYFLYFLKPRLKRAGVDKLREVRKRIEQSGRNIRLEIDGGVKTDGCAPVALYGPPPCTSDADCTGTYGAVRRWEFKTLGTGRVAVMQTPRAAKA